MKLKKKYFFCLLVVPFIQILFRENFLNMARKIFQKFQVFIAKTVGEDRFLVISSYLLF